MSEICQLSVKRGVTVSPQLTADFHAQYTVIHLLKTPLYFKFQGIFNVEWGNNSLVSSLTRIGFSEEP